MIYNSWSLFHMVFLYLRNYTLVSVEASGIVQSCFGKQKKAENEALAFFHTDRFCWTACLKTHRFL